MTWSDRRLFYTHSILIYARNGSSADAIAARLEEVCQQFHQRTGAPPAHGLLIVNETDDTRIGELQPEQLLANASDNVDSDAKRKHELTRIGIPFSEFSLSLTVPIDKQQLAKQTGFTTAGMSQIEWAAATPSENRSAEFGEHLIDGGLKAQNFNFFQRILILPFMPLIHSILNDALNAERDTVLYGCLCKTQPGWTDEKRKKEIKSYQQLRMGKVVKSLKAATQEVKKATKE